MDNSRYNSKGNITMVEHSINNKLRMVDKSTQTGDYYVLHGSLTMVQMFIQSTQTISVSTQST